MSSPHKLIDHLAELEKAQGLTLMEGYTLKAMWIVQHLSSIDRLADVYHPYYTLHNLNHLRTVENNLFAVASNTRLLNSLNPHALSPAEIFILISGAYMHDLGMLIQDPEDEYLAQTRGVPVGEIIREDHAERSARYITQQHHLFHLSKVDAEHIAALCRGHRLISLAGPEYDMRYDTEGKPIRLRLLTELLRVADELDMGYPRAPEDQFDLLKINTVFDRHSRIHWQKHYYTESVSFHTEDRPGKPLILRVNVTLRVPDQIHASYLEEQIMRRLNQHLGDNSTFAPYDFEIQPGEFRHIIRPELMSSILYRPDVHSLYVDDDSDWQEQVVMHLSDRGFTSVEVASGVEEAWAVLSRTQQEKPLKLAIFDLNMKNGEGVHSARAGLQLIPSTRALHPEARIIVFTGSADPDSEIIQDAYRLGAQVLSKNVGPRELGQLIEDMLRQSYIIMDRQDPKEAEMAVNEYVYAPASYWALIVDDDTDWADQLRIFLEDLGYRVRVATGAQEACEVLERARYHCVITDNRMPDRDGSPDPNAGLDLARFIQASYPDTDIVILTAVPTYEALKQSLDLGTVAYLEKKDYGPREIAQHLQTLFHSRKVTLYYDNGAPARADRMYFFGKQGIVVKRTTVSTSEHAGVVEIDGEKFRATTFGLPISEVHAGTTVRLRAIVQGAIQVETQSF